VVFQSVTWRVFPSTHHRSGCSRDWSNDWR